MAVLPAHHLGWKDVGSWDSLLTILKADLNRNIKIGKHIVLVDSKNTFIQSSDPNRLVAVVGMEDVVIVDHENALLVCKKGDAQKIQGAHPQDMLGDQRRRKGTFFDRYGGFILKIRRVH